MTALHVAANRNDDMVVKVLLNMKVDVNAVNVRVGLAECVLEGVSEKKWISTGDALVSRSC